MRYDTPVYFQQIERSNELDSEGNYAADTITEEKRYASISSTGTETLRLVYGEIRQDSRTIRLLTPYAAPFDRIRIGEGDAAKIYQVDMMRRLRSKQTFIVSEVQ